MEYTPVVGIAIVLFALAQILKLTVLKNNAELKSVIPYFCAILGAVIGIVLFMVDPASLPGAKSITDAVLMGAGSGLLATGAHQIFKQFAKIIAVGNATKKEVEQEVANMSSEEKKEYIASQAADLITTVIDKANNVPDDNNENKNEDSDTESNSSKSESVQSSASLLGLVTERHTDSTTEQKDESEEILISESPNRNITGI